jgi:hypothetical protein
LKVWRQCLVLHHRNSEQDSELAAWESLREVLLVCFSYSCIGEAAHGAEHAAAENAVADGKCPAVLEGIAEPRKVAHVCDKFLALPQVFILRIERLPTVG